MTRSYRIWIETMGK